MVELKRFCQLPMGMASQQAFKGKHVLITGAAGGIGHALCRRLVLAGATVTVFDKARPVDPLVGVKYHVVDIADFRENAHAIEQVRKPINILINNAGVMRRGSLFKATEEDWDYLFSVNLKAQWLVLNAARGKLARRATLVFVASQHGIHLPSDPALYALTKAGVISFARLVANTMPKYRVKLACPGATDTELHRTGRTAVHLAAERKAGRLCSPDEVAKHVFRLLVSDACALLYDRNSCRYRLQKTLPCS